MKQGKPTACLAYHDLTYHGIGAPSPQFVEALASYSQATIAASVEISDEALAQGLVPPSITPFAFIILVLPQGAYDEVVQDCANYVQRTLGKTLQGVVWLRGQGATQRIWGIDGSLSSDARWIPAWPVPQSDGVHYTVEIKRREPDTYWELMESGWECSNRFDDEGEAEVVAHTMALRHDGDMDARVISPAGVVLTTFRLQKCLDTRRRGTREKREELPPHVTIPMLRDVLEGYRVSRQEHAYDTLA
ncbi:hypothetical protein KDA_74890 [Dictyobacter alpinus]|uniref:Uncharacterized protein n=1 Tax=Dictyobacter alpinus TaxID=2014873 RepID=A0A402BKX0_9CHLR|nr:hypothetical protein [Dictyobacter alpinus]GCE32005.1 hypothetical protein KDA_74890 [Dictyobacter alpinus]